MSMAIGIVFLSLLVVSLIVVAVCLFKHNIPLVKRWLIVVGFAFIAFMITAIAPRFWNNCACQHNCCGPGCNCSCVKGAH